jgi:hypothetical protein
MKPICPASLWTNTLTFLRVARLNSFISGGNMTINVNGDIGPYFQTKKKTSDKVILYHRFSLILLLICLQ